MTTNEIKALPWRDLLSDLANVVFRGETSRFKETTESISVRPRTIYPNSELGNQFRTAYNLTKMIVNGSAYSIILVGSPGLGKSTVVERCLQQYKVRYAMNKGVATPKALYRMLYEANGNVLVLDDSDSVLRDKNAQNILKAALDNKLQRKISWTSEARSRHYLPQSFIYTGRIIFISNIPLDRFPEALRSRSYLCEVDGGRMEKLEYVLSMMANYPQSEQVKAEIRAFLVENALNLREISLRSLDKIITLRTQFPTDWKTIALKSI